jgi:hypothetical protein
MPKGFGEGFKVSGVSAAAGLISGQFNQKSNFVVSYKD